MEINIHIFSKKPDADFTQAAEEYIKRSSPFCRLSIKHYKKSGAITLNKGAKLYIVSPDTDTISSEELATLINSICVSGYSAIDFIIPDGFDTDYINNISADAEDFHISSFELEAELCAVSLSEQLYRAFTILNNITYHK